MKPPVRHPAIAITVVGPVVAAQVGYVTDTDPNAFLLVTAVNNPA